MEKCKRFCQHCCKKKQQYRQNHLSFYHWATSSHPWPTNLSPLWGSQFSVYLSFNIIIEKLNSNEKLDGFSDSIKKYCNQQKIGLFGAIA
jgi:hypothetical protein